MRIPRQAMAVLVVCLAASSEAAAQDWLLAGTASISANTRFGTVSPQPVPVYDAPVIGGGRYFVRGTTAIDIRTGAAVSVGPGFPVAFDTARPRVFVARADGIWVVDVEFGVNYLLSPGPTFAVGGCDYATSVDALVCVVTRSSTEHDIVRIEGTARRVIATSRVDFGAAGRLWVLSPDGTRFYFQRCTPVAQPVGPSTCKDDLAMLDVASGGLLTLPAWALPLGAVGSMTWDELNERLLLSVGPYAQAVTKDLQVIGSAFIGGTCHAFAVSQHTGRLYVVRSDPATPGGSAFVLDSATYQSLQPAVTMPPGSGVSCAAVRVLTAPGPPRNLRASVTGRGDVDVSWTNVGGAGGFVLEVGYGPGRRDLQLFLDADATERFTNVPPGTYYLRVRGGNVFGGGRLSDEIQVVVP